MGISDPSLEAPLRVYSSEGDVGTPPLRPGSQLAPAADPAELASLLRAFLAAGDRPRASGVAAQLSASWRLGDLAFASVADALAIVSATGLLRLVERNLAEAAGGNAGQELANNSVRLVLEAVNSHAAAICTRVAEERGLLRALVLLVARGPAAPGNGSRATILDAAIARQQAATAVMILATNSAVAGLCARTVDALSDADLQALVDASASRGKHAADNLSPCVTSILGGCLGHAPLLPRLVGPAGLPLTLTKILADEGHSEGARFLAAESLLRLIDVTREHGPPLATWAKPIVKHLRADFARAVRGREGSSAA